MTADEKDRNMTADRKRNYFFLQRYFQRIESLKQASRDQRRGNRMELKWRISSYGNGI